MPQQSEGQTGQETPVIPAEAEVKRLEFTPAEIAADLGRVERVLAYAVEDEGERLWSLGWTERNCRPIVERVLSGSLPERMAVSLAQASAALEGVDALPWTERLEPIRKALSHVNEAIEECPPVTDAEFSPKAVLVVPVEEPREERNREGDQEESGSRRRGRKRERTETSSEPHQFFPLGHPEHSGKSLEAVEGLSEDLAVRLKSAGIESVADLLTRPPTDHERLQLVEVESDLDALLGEGPLEVAMRGVLLARWERFEPGKGQSEMAFQHGEQILHCRFSERPPRERPTDSLTLVGGLERDGDRLVLRDPMGWRADTRGVVRRPIYEIPEVEESEIRFAVRLACAQFLPAILDPLPEKALKTGRVPGLRECINEMHKPRSGLHVGRSRLVFGELYLQQIRAAASGKARHKSTRHDISHEAVTQLQLQHGLELSDDQEQAFDEIRRDLRRPVAMARLLQGDVDTGKARVALLSAVLVASGKSQVLFLAPDALAAEHRALFAEPLLRSIGLVPQLIPGEPSKAQIDAIVRGEAHIIFGTHALLASGLPEFKRLGLVVVEERSTFGVVDREKLTQGKNQPDLLVVTSVPIPTSLAFTLFSGFDISLIPKEERDPGESEILTPEEREKAYERVRECLAEGRQGYVVFPLHEGVDVLDRERAEILVAAMGHEAFPDAKVALYHGSMSREERYRVFEDFLHRRLDVLVSTTAIEDAPEATNAAAIMIENADRFDLVRLHRLRGHVGGGSTPGYCAFVLSDKPEEEGHRLVELLSQEEDGFSIAEWDREARGDEELLGERVSELPQFKWADPIRDRKTLLRARRAAFETLLVDPQLRQRIHRQLAHLVWPDERPAETEAPRGQGSRRRRRRRRRN